MKFLSVLLTFAGISALKAETISLNNSIKSTGFDFACPSEQIIYLCTTLSTFMEWTVTAGEDVVQADFDMQTAIAAEGQRQRLTTADEFVYFQYFDSQNITVSQLSFVVSQKNSNGSVMCQSSSNFVTLAYMLAGIPRSLQSVSLNPLRENVGFCTYSYLLLWEPPENYDSVDLMSYTIEVDNSLLSVVTHTSIIPQYSIEITLFPGDHNITVYGIDRCQKTTPITLSNISVPQPRVPNYVIVLIAVSAIFWVVLLVLCLGHSIVTICTWKEDCIHRFSISLGIGSSVLLIISAALLIGLGIVIALYDGMNSLETCTNFIVRRDILATLPFIIIMVFLLPMGVVIIILLLLMLLTSLQPLSGIFNEARTLPKRERTRTQSSEIDMEEVEAD